MRVNEYGDVVPDVTPGPRVRPVELHKAQWLVAARWRRRAALECKRAGLTFTEWLVIDALRELLEEINDAVSQNDLALRSGLRRGNICDLMPSLEKKNLVSRGPSATGRALRLFPTDKAYHLLEWLYPRLDAISRPTERAP